MKVPYVASVRLMAALGTLAVGALAAACSGGGSTATAPPAGPPLGGIGPAVTLDQHVNFTVVVPPATVTATIAARRKRRRPADLTPYVSPNTASVTLQVVSVSGRSLRALPPLLTVDISCGGANGCSVPIQNVPAATGTDRFAIQTFSATGATGNLISSGFVDVPVPSAKAASFGGTALTIGGYVQSLSLALNIPGGSFVSNTPATGTLDVNAIDPGGAIIIGSDTLANAIAVSLPVSDAGVFALNNVQQVALQQPAQSIALEYSGSVSSGGTVAASTIDENSQPVSTSLPIPVNLPPVPSPSPVSSAKPALSLYVLDGTTDRIYEYDGINRVEEGLPFSTSPRRLFDVAAPASLNATVTCGAPLLFSLAVSSTGTLFGQSSCFDTSTSTIGYTFVYDASAREGSAPGGSPVPPVPARVLTAAGVPAFAGPLDAKLDEAAGVLYLSYGDANFNAPAIFGVSLAANGGVATTFGATCLQELGDPSGCASDSSNAYSGTTNFALDGGGNLLVPQVYTQTSGSTTFVPPGASTQVVNEGAILAFPVTSNTAVATPASAIAGYATDLGGSTTSFIAVDRGIIYTLNYSNGVPDPFNGGATYQPGLSGCSNPPSTNARINVATSTCVDGAAHQYFTAYPSGIADLRDPANAGTDVASMPSLIIGGDSIGNFGDANISNAAGGDLFAVKDGFAYVVNQQPPNGGPPEIDVYYLGAIPPTPTSASPPITKLVFPAGFTDTIQSIAIGATGTSASGQALLRLPGRVHHDVNAIRARIARVRNARRDASQRERP